MVETPRLTGDALGAVKHRGTHLQIIASAGSGKTEVVSQRVADLLADGVRPDGIVAFTFTERAAGELKERIEQRVVDRMGPAAIDRLSGLFVGTIHSYCFRLLQTHVPEYENFDVLDENQLTAFACREAYRLGIRQFDDDNRLFRSVARFLESVDVVENELLDVDSLPAEFGSVLTDYYAALDRYRLLTYGQQIRAAVEALGRDEVAERVRGQLRHLIVDEYQDINPAQEELIRLLAGPSTELCVVGDDDQAIYQWRGSDVENIVTFADRYAPVTSYTIATNRRSRPEIVRTANQFAKSIPDRLAKVMRSYRPSAGSAPRVVVWDAEDEQSEAEWIAEMVCALRDGGVPYKDIGVLVRSRAAYPRLLGEFNASDVPVQPGGRTGLFDQPEAVVLGKTYCWLADIDWREQYRPGGTVELGSLLAEYESVFDLRDRAHTKRLNRHLTQWQENSGDESRTVDLVSDFYDLLDLLGVRDWDLDDPIRLNSLGTLARFTSLLADYESVRRRSRQDADNYGEQVGGEWAGEWYHRNLAIHIVNYAQGSYEGFDGEPEVTVDAVDITTIHKAKGLEWPAVFVPSMTKNRFPSSRTGRQRDWIVPRDLFDAERYEGSDADERRLFYVAISRAREWLSVSRHDRVTKQSAQPSPYWTELDSHHIDPGDVDLPEFEPRTTTDGDPLAITFSDLASFLECGMAYRLRTLVGFQPRLAPELGYGRAVHHLLRRVAEQTQASGVVPTANGVEQMLDNHFFLPAANKAAHRMMKDAAKRLIQGYIENHEDDLHRVWQTERPFELHLDAVTVSGRADVILDRENGIPSALAIVDYKTSIDDSTEPYKLQLQVYADAGRREGLDVRGAYVHDLQGERKGIEIDDVTIQSAERRVETAALKIRHREFEPSPGPRCRTCEVRTICRAKHG